MHQLLPDRQCRGCGWPAVNGQDSCEQCAVEPWENRAYVYSREAEERRSKGYE